MTRKKTVLWAFVAGLFSLSMPPAIYANETDAASLKPYASTARANLADPLSTSRAEPETRDGAKSREVNSDKDRLIWDFTNVAFSDALWLDNSIDPSSSLAPFKSYLQRRDKSGSHETWVSEFVSRSKGVPAHDRIVKWEEPIAIGIGWPQYGNTGYEATEPSLEKLAAAQIEALIPDLRNAVRQDIDFVPPSDPREKTSNYPRIRIVFILGTNLRNHFKVLNILPGARIDDWYYQLNSLYTGAIPFTANARAQVDGFLLPRADNSLGLAVCRILGTLPPDMIRSLISECLVRAMGLPESSHVNSNALTGPWNHALNGTEKVPSSDGREAIVWPSDMRNRGRELLQYYRTMPEIKRAIALPFAITDYDRQLLSILYCPKVKVGADKYSVLTSLINDNSCFRSPINH